MSTEKQDLPASAHGKNRAGGPPPSPREDFRMDIPISGTVLMLHELALQRFCIAFGTTLSQSRSLQTMANRAWILARESRYRPKPCFTERRKQANAAFIRRFPRGMQAASQ